MRRPPSTHIFVAAVLLLAGFVLAQPRRRGPQEDDFPLPADAEEPAEYSFGRLMYRNSDDGWRRRGSWGVDSPMSERHFLEGVRRLTGIHARPMERYLSLMDDELFDYPWLCVVEVGYWALSEEEIARLREYLLRGGFLMVDDFHGTSEWMAFAESMKEVFPDRPIVDVLPSDPVFHVFYDLEPKVQVPGRVYLRTGRTYERDGVDPRWRGIYDDQGRLMVMINFNMDLGDAWEWADSPEYPEHWSALAYRFGINYLVYAMTH